jgi:hypothetical protein
MNSFKQLNNLLGWLVFAVATYTYTATVEPTGSFWDCGEFIAVSYKLMVPHPPGAPFFLLVGRMFSLLAGSDVTQVAFWVNMVSVLSSAFSSLFLFWTITLLARKIFATKDAELSSGQSLAILGAGLIGSLAYTFSDSAWFSAVEAEVYAMSSFFTAIVFWAILKWDAVADEPMADRWLIFIAYMMGLSIGVHLLNLVTIPAMAYVYYFRRYQFSMVGAAKTFMISLVILGIIQVGVITGLPGLANSFEILFVNSFGLPFNSGILFFVSVFLGSLVYFIRRTQLQGQFLPNLALICFAFVLIGYASYGIILIRSNFNPPIDENDPENAISFVSYLKREQYGDRPLLYGPQFNASPVRTVDGDPVYVRGNDKYEEVDKKAIQEYDSKDKTLLPRIYSPQGNHIQAYQNWGLRLRVDESASAEEGRQVYRKPSFSENIGFLLKYQIGHMYLRYFGWNFIGRVSDIQDAGVLFTPFSDKGLPESVQKNRGRNRYFALPLLLGIAGLFFQWKREKNGAIIVALLFFFTGIAIVIYLNQPPVEPRERDYTFAGSYYAFCIWIGLGVLWLWDFLRKFLRDTPVNAIVSTGLAMVVPVVMVQGAWDDHDRSQRYHSVDSAKNLLNSCAKNAILFTGGDNDTFPLWYAQEVEGFRTDVRVCNLSLLGTDWYVSQMKRQAYESTPLPISLELNDYIQGKNDYIPYVEKGNLKGGVSLKQLMSLIQEENPALMVPTQGGKAVATFPTKTFYIDIDSAKVASMPWMPARDKGRVLKRLSWTIGKNALYKNDFVVLNILSNLDWSRPVYFSTTLSTSSYLNLKPYMQLEGLAYRLMPINNPGASDGVVNTPVMYQNMTKNMFWRNLDNPEVYYDENYKRFPLNSRKSFYMLASQLLNESKMESNPAMQSFLPPIVSGKSRKDLAREVMEYCFRVMPDKATRYDVYTPQFIPLLQEVGNNNLANDIASVTHKRAVEDLEYETKNPRLVSSFDIQTNVYILQQLASAYRDSPDKARSTLYKADFDRFLPYAQTGQEGGDYEEE